MTGPAAVTIPAGPSVIDEPDISRSTLFRQRRGYPVRVGRWFYAPHTALMEATVLAATYAAYDSSRGLAGGGRWEAVRHARTIWTLEHWLHLSGEHNLQRAVQQVPGLVDIFGVGYATFHLGVTGLVLFWLYRVHRTVFVRVRTALVVASGLALTGFALYPTAPPRLAGIGISDTLELGRATSESGLLRFAYTPYAAMPSIHVAYAVIVGGGVVLAARHRWTRLAGALYPLFVAVEVVATGNHFVFDALAGAAVALVATLVTSHLWNRARPTERPARAAMGLGITATVPRPLGPRRTATVTLRNSLRRVGRESMPTRSADGRVRRRDGYGLHEVGPNTRQSG
jgi:hypothetical protein